MIDNSKEYIVCAAYKTNKDTPHLKYLIDKGLDAKNIYYEPHRQVMDIVTGWRHSDIILKFDDIIDKEDRGGFMTSKGRYVNRIEAMKIALEAGQVTKEKAIREDGKNGGYWALFSEDIYLSIKEMFKSLLDKLCCKHKLELHDKVHSKRVNYLIILMSHTIKMILICISKIFKLKSVKKMNIYYLKKIRKAVWDKYKIQKWDFTDKPWHICDKLDTSLPYSDFDSYGEALESLMHLWHKEAEKFLWENRTKRKIHKKTYPW